MIRKTMFAAVAALTMATTAQAEEPSLSTQDCEDFAGLIGELMNQRAYSGMTRSEALELATERLSEIGSNIEEARRDKVAKQLANKVYNIPPTKLRDSEFVEVTIGTFRVRCARQVEE